MLRRAILSLTAIVLGLGCGLLPPPAARALTGFSRPVITNLADVGVIVTWETAQRASGTVTYGTAKPPLSRASESGINGALGDVHSVSLSGLLTSTTYYYSVSQGGYTDDNDGSFYTFTTGPTLPGIQTNQSLTGKVLKAGGVSPAVGVLVVLKVIDNYTLNPTTSQPSGVISALTNASGNWTISLNNIRSADASINFIYQTTTPYDYFQYSVSGGSLGDWQSTVVPMSFTNNSMTVSNVVLVPGLPTSTSTPITPTLSPTRTLTAAATVSASVTPSPAPTVSTPTIVPTAVPSTPTLVPLAVAAPPPADVPTKIPVDTPTDVPPVPQAIDTPIASAPAAAAPVPTEPPATSTAVPPSKTPVATSSRPNPRGSAGASAPATLAPMRPFATATSLEATTVVSPSPSPVATIDAIRPEPLDSPGPRPTFALLAGLALLVVGIVVVTAGFVSQTREN